MSISINRRRACLSTLALGAAALPGLSLAQAYPTRAIELVVPYPPGASTDMIARTLQPRMSALLGQQVVVDNKGGAGGNIGAAYVARSPADGYRLLLATNAVTTLNPHVSRNTQFDALKDLIPVGQICNGPLANTVNADLPVSTLPELVAYAKKNPGKLSFGTPGNGSPQHVFGELLKQRAEIFMVHVPYRGIGPALTDLLAGNIQVMVATLSSVTAQLAGGKVRVLAIGESQRLPTSPDIPTVAETYSGFFASAWFGIYAPAGTPSDIIQRLNAALNGAVAAEDVRAKLAGAFLPPSTGTPEALGKLTLEDHARWGKLIAERGIKAD